MPPADFSDKDSSVSKKPFPLEGVSCFPPWDYPSPACTPFPEEVPGGVPHPALLPAEEQIPRPCLALSRSDIEQSSVCSNEAKQLPVHGLALGGG